MSATAEETAAVVKRRLERDVLVAAGLRVEGEVWYNYRVFVRTA